MNKFNTGGMVTIGIDISDRSCHMIALAQEDGEVMWEHKVATRAPALQRVFGELSGSRIALEVGTHSGWMCRLLSSLGHEVWVANARKLRLVYENKRKSDRVFPILFTIPFTRVIARRPELPLQTDTCDRHTETKKGEKQTTSTV